MTSAPEEALGNPGESAKTEDPGVENEGTISSTGEDEQKMPHKLIITPEVSANLWKASAAIFIGINR